MSAKRQVNTAGPVSCQTCRHHWMIEYAQDATSKGVCRLCGAERQFNNNLQSAAEREKAARQPRPQQAEWEAEEAGSLVA